MVTIIWDMLLDETHRNEGVSIIRKIWKDMKDFEGYIQHDILIDDDNPNHITIISRWTKRELADQSVIAYANSEPIRLLTPILAGPRKRCVFNGDAINE